MLEAIKSFFASSMAAESETEDERIPDIRLAACALLLEIAHADDEFTSDERAHLRGAIRRQYGVQDDEAIDELIRLADEERRKAVDLYQFTRLIREHYNHGQKMVLLEVMWGLVYADGDPSTDEDLLMRKVCNLLNLQVGYLSDVQKRVRDGQ